jgi:hypothetical protein
VVAALLQATDGGRRPPQLLPCAAQIKRERSLRTSPFSKLRLKNYFFFLTAFFFLAGAFFLVAMENHPLFKSHLLREIVQINIYHSLRIKFFS